MDSDYPPLPSSRATDSSLQNLSLSDGEAATQVSSGTKTPISMTNGQGQDFSQPQAQVIVEDGDLILEYVASKLTDPSVTFTHRWVVSSDTLRENSPYFRALLDPNKFSEGRALMKQRESHGPHAGLVTNGDAAGPSGLRPGVHGFPSLRLPNDYLSHRLGPDTIGFFLRALSFNSFNEEEKENFDAEVKTQRPSFVAGVIELADAFNSPQFIQDTLRRSGYTLGKPKLPLTRFTSSMLKLNEDRVRQSIYIANFLNDRVILQMLTHTLIVMGSRFWVNGIERPEPGTLPWHFFSGGLEEELYYRRQSVLNTITDLQAHFLRIYGALEVTTATKPGIISTPSAATSRQYQCRCGLGNSSACDTFHLGQMTRFFSLRTKTIFVGSTLIDPDFDPDIDETEAEPEGQAERPADITSIISLLKQCPDYQIDSNHTACGIRRRFLPSLDCIEGFVGDERGLLGMNLNRWRGEGNRGVVGLAWPHIQGSWANRSHRRALVIDLRLARITGVPRLSPGTPAAEFREEDARLLFTAKRRNWEA
ncbi:uncharacterized protein BDV17DRAFT_249377 [Aspergillus undulatus]|uniref:uncharacterized protein n=1 Tax=Aspergillus undulatus TaxID=1810928 RepID=UPI003CCCA2D8